MMYIMIIIAIAYISLATLLNMKLDFYQYLAWYFREQFGQSQHGRVVCARAKIQQLQKRRYLTLYIQYIFIF